MGEDEHAVKKELQEKKAQANDDRKRAAGAIADAAAPKPAAKRAKTTTDGDPVSPPLPGDHSDPTNSAYYKEVQSDNSPNFGSVSWHGVGKPIAIDK